MCGLRDGVVETLVGIRREVHRDGGAWRERADHFHIQHHFAVGVAAGLAGTAGHRYLGHRRHRADAEPLDVLREIRLGEAAAQLNHRHRLAAAIGVGRKVV